MEEGKEDEPKRVSSSPMIIQINSGQCGTIENYDYTKNIKLYIE